MRVLVVATLALSLGMACSDPAPPAPAPEELPEPEPTPEEPAPAREAPTPPADELKSPDRKPTSARPKKPATKKPAAKSPGKPDVKKGSIAVKGDAKTVVFLGDGNDRQYKDGSDAATPGAYKVKAWFVGDPVPKVAASITVSEGEAVVVTCSSKGQWCREGEHPVESMDTGQ